MSPDIFHRFLILPLYQILWVNLLFFDLLLDLHLLCTSSDPTTLILISCLTYLLLLLLLLLSRGYVLSEHERLKLDIEHFYRGQASTLSEKGIE